MITLFKSNNILQTYRIHQDLAMAKISTQLEQWIKSYAFLSNNLMKKIAKNCKKSQLRDFITTLRLNLKEKPIPFSESTFIFLQDW